MYSSTSFDARSFSPISFAQADESHLDEYELHLEFAQVMRLLRVQSVKPVAQRRLFKGKQKPAVASLLDVDPGDVRPVSVAFQVDGKPSHQSTRQAPESKQTHADDEMALMLILMEAA